MASTTKTGGGVGTKDKPRGVPDHPELDPVIAMDELGVRMYYERLTRIKEKTIEELQENVFTNYSEFVHISKEIANILFFLVYFTLAQVITYIMPYNWSMTCCI